MDASCSQTNDGLINLNVTPPNNYTYIWSNGGNTNMINNLTANTYSVKILNPQGECVFNTYTVSVQGVNCGNIIGKVYFDSIMNCVEDPSEYGIPNTQLKAMPGNYTSVTDAFGNYIFHALPFGTYTLSHLNNLAGITTNCGNNINMSITLPNQNLIHNFGDTTTSLNDYSLYATTNNNCFPLANPNKKIFLKYRRNTPAIAPMPLYQTGIVFLHLDSISHFNYSIPPHTSISGDTVFWNVANITYPSYNTIQCYLNFPFTYTIANTFPYTAGITNTQFSDVNLYNNIQSSIVPFCNGYDPNNKIVFPTGIDAPGYLDINDPWSKLMTYTINFQNTGNAPAYNIIIEDTLSDKLDISTFEVLNTSHPYQIEIVNNHIIKWKFYNIMLPDSTTNEPESHGNIVYRIRQNTNNVLGDVIHNTAYIYFDYNPAIITNKTTNTLYKPSKVKEYIRSKTNINIYPNPANDIVFIESEEMFNNIIVYDALMKKVQSIIMDNTNSTQINTKTLCNGIYFVKTNHSEMKKLVINR